MFYHQEWLQLLALIGWSALVAYYAYRFGQVKGYSKGRDDANSE